MIGTVPAMRGGHSDGPRGAGAEMATGGGLSDGPGGQGTVTATRGRAQRWPRGLGTAMAQGCRRSDGHGGGPAKGRPACLTSLCTGRLCSAGEKLSSGLKVMIETCYFYVLFIKRSSSNFYFIFTEKVVCDFIMGVNNVNF